MVIFRCPVCKQNHSIKEYEQKEYTCTNALRQNKKSQNLVNKANLTGTSWNTNEWSTREDTYEDLEILGIQTMPSDKNKYNGGTRSHNY